MRAGLVAWGFSLLFQVPDTVMTVHGTARRLYGQDGNMKVGVRYFSSGAATFKIFRGIWRGYLGLSLVESSRPKHTEFAAFTATLRDLDSRRLLRCNKRLVTTFHGIGATWGHRMARATDGLVWPAVKLGTNHQQRKLTITAQLSSESLLPRQPPTDQPTNRPTSQGQ